MVLGLAVGPSSLRRASRWIYKEATSSNSQSLVHISTTPWVKMRFILSSLATAALALVPFAAPTAITREVTTDLPARFAMYLVTAEPRANGLRVQYANCQSSFPLLEYLVSMAFH